MLALPTNHLLPAALPHHVVHLSKIYYRRDGVVVRASASKSVDLGFNPLVESYQKTFKKMVSTASLLGARHLGEVV